ncbi:hypothetical protein GCM10017774_78060 [Lentzea cavernae]|uniref:Uncharacterized protein n=1 Tax=Lentzea cavernae TaxID=2020703 RepID=A0ABQ3MUH2_9PSEU|nr:hypothetical protein GCM10017774_78060 [Lentzea cavernae]
MGSAGDAMNRRRVQAWCTVTAYALGALAVLGILTIVIVSAVIGS